MATQPISITHITLQQNPAPFLAPIHFNLTFQVHCPLTAPLQWRIIYLGSASDEAYDQTLEEFETEAVELGSPMQCYVECPAPDWKKIPRREFLSLTAIIITVSYRQQEFLRIGYYVHIAADRTLPEDRKKALPPSELVKHLSRTILIDKPRITKFDINLASEGQQRGKAEEMEGTPSRAEKIEGENSSQSISKTSCNEKADLADLVHIPSPEPTPLKGGRKEKKIKKTTKRSQL